MLQRNLKIELHEHLTTYYFQMNNIAEVPLSQYIQMAKDFADYKGLSQFRAEFVADAKRWYRKVYSDRHQ